MRIRTSIELILNSLTNRDNSVGILIDYGLNDLMIGSGAHQWVPGDLSLGGKAAGVKLTAHLHLVPRSRMRGAIPPLPNTPSWRGAQLKHRDNFTFTFYTYYFAHFEYPVFGLGKVDRWNPIRTSAIQSRSRPMRFLPFPDHEKGAPWQEISK
jgi:hypothetical protein